MVLFYQKMVVFFLLSTSEASASVGHSFLSFLMGLLVEGLWELCWLLLLLRERLSLCSSFSVDCASFYLPDHFWSFCYLEISFLVSNFRQHCGKPKKHCSGAIPPFHKIFWLIFLLSCSLSPIIQLSCHKYCFHSLL